LSGGRGRSEDLRYASPPVSRYASPPVSMGPGRSEDLRHHGTGVHEEHWAKSFVLFVVFVMKISS